MKHLQETKTHPVAYNTALVITYKSTKNPKDPNERQPILIICIRPFDVHFTFELDQIKCEASFNLY